MSFSKQLPMPRGEPASPPMQGLESPSRFLQSSFDSFINFDPSSSVDQNALDVERDGLSSLFEDTSISPLDKSCSTRLGTRGQTGSGSRAGSSGSDRSLSAVPDMGIWAEEDFQWATFDGIPAADLQGFPVPNESDFLKDYPMADFNVAPFNPSPKSQPKPQALEPVLNNAHASQGDFEKALFNVPASHDLMDISTEANTYPDPSIQSQVAPYYFQDTQPTFYGDPFIGGPTDVTTARANFMNGMYNDPVLFNAPAPSVYAEFHAPEFQAYDGAMVPDMNGYSSTRRSLRNSSSRNPRASVGRRRTRGSYPSDNSSPLSPSQASPSSNVGRSRGVRGYKPERPQKDQGHDWVRINTTTEGKSSRTGKINRYDPKRDGKYRSTSHPFGGRWSSTHYTFSFNRYGELSKHTYSIEELQQFIYEHPSNEHSNLIMWIQKNPADSARRYPTVDSSKCRFENCPGAAFSRSIGVGLYRIAFDEQWSTYGEQRDPFHVAGYVHLYCLERFLDFPDICNRFDVRADNREISTEPRAKFGPSLGYDIEFDVAAGFIQACKSGALDRTYPEYPQHHTYARGAAKHHQGTLTCALTKAKNKHQNPSKRRMQESRGLKASHILVHLGDLEMQVKARRADKDSRRRGAAGPGDSDDELPAPAPYFGAQPEFTLQPAPIPTRELRKRKAIKDEDSDSDVVVVTSKRCRVEEQPAFEAPMAPLTQPAPDSTFAPSGFCPHVAPETSNFAIANLLGMQSGSVISWPQSCVDPAFQGMERASGPVVEDRLVPYGESDED